MKKILMAVLLFGLTSVQANAETKLKYGPTANPRAVPVGKSNEYFRSAKNGAPDFWAMVGYYVPQTNASSCGAAALAMSLNAAKVWHPKTSDDRVVREAELFEKVNAEQKKMRLPEYKTDRGVNLDPFGKFAETAFKLYGFEQVKVKTVHLDKITPETKQKLIADLAANEKSGKNFILANFNQQAFTDDVDAGHWAPLAAYDSKSARVLVFDPDREYFEPYWVSVDTLMAGMATYDTDSKANRGYVFVSVED